MKLLKFELSQSEVSLPDFIARGTQFRDGIKAIAPTAQVSLSFASTGQVTGDVQIQRLPISRLQETYDSISAFINTQFPGIEVSFLYQDSEDD